MDKIEVTQADIDAWEIYGPKIFHCEMTGPEALAARLATHTDATPVAWLHTLHMKQGQVSTRLTDWDCVDPDEPSWGVFGRPGRDYSEEYTVTTQPLYTHPPATDVAALVEAAKAILHAVCHETGFAAAVRADSGLAYPWEPLDIAEAQLRQALAPFTKGQNDDAVR